MSQNFKKNLLHSFAKHQLTITDQQADLLSRYYFLSEKWGSKINITANLSPDKFLEENILDPALSFHTFKKAFPQAQETKPSLIDVGCGGGYAGLVWIILSKFSFELILLDGDRKKINFCKQFIRENKLPSCQAVALRLEEYLKNQQQNQFDIVISRATWGCESFVKNCQPLARPFALLCYFNSSKALPSHLAHFGKILPYSILPRGLERQLVVFQNSTII